MYRPPDDVVDRVQAEAEALQVFLFRVVEGAAAAVQLVDEQTFEGRGLRHGAGDQAWRSTQEQA